MAIKLKKSQKVKLGEKVGKILARAKTPEPEPEEESVEGEVVDEGTMMEPQVRARGNDREDSVSVTFERKTSLPVLQETDKEFNIAEVKKRLKFLPEMQCSTCAIGPECPEFKEGFVCAFNKTFDEFPTRSVEDVLEAMRFIINKNKTRLFRAFVSEEIVTGGQLDMNVTRQSDVVMSQMRGFLELQRETQRVTVVATGEKKQGILSKLFGSQARDDELPLNPPEDVSKELTQGTDILLTEANDGKIESKVLVDQREPKEGD